jgi:hypothetical protein
MNGITGYVSIMIDDNTYLNYNKLDKLKHDLYCLKVAGISGIWLIEYEDRKLKVSEVKRQIIIEERVMKLKKLSKNEISRADK